MDIWNGRLDRVLVTVVAPDGKYALALAAQEWIAYQDEDPVKVAQAWVKRQAPKG